MRDKIYIIIISSIFITLMIGCPSIYLLSKLGITTLPENKNIKLPERVYTESDFLAPVLNSIERGKANLENIYSNGLPAYENITRFMLDNERSMREFLLETLYSFESAENANNTNILENTKEIETTIADNAPTETTEPEKPKIQYKAKLIGTEDFNKAWAFTEIDKPYSEGWTDKTLRASEEELHRRVETQLGHVNRIANANHDVNFYVYVCTRFQETEVFGEIIKDIRVMQDEISTKPFMDEFFAGLDMTAVNAYDYFKVDTLEERLERIYKTDHHESPRGVQHILRRYKYDC